ncbi:hypothetical protein C367_04307 [Cryptococcus neoformans Ze90-1]|nr:hypothetical protein C367_04307 [Cryptococcus neoformans var. grubii Ze90-1]
MSPFAAPTHCMQQYYSHQVKYQRIDGPSEVEKRLPVILRSRVAGNLRAEEVWAIILEHSVAYWRQSGPSGETAHSQCSCANCLKSTRSELPEPIWIGQNRD